MKYYLNLKPETKNHFILNYEINNNQIIVNYASGVIENIPYTKENEEELRNKMRLQYEQFPKGSFSNEYEREKVLGLFGSLCIISSIILLPFNLILGLFSFFFTSILLLPSVHFKSIKKDILKTEEFLVHEKDINENIDIDNLFDNVSKKTIIQIEKAKIEAKEYDKSEVLSLNEIDKISLKDLTKISANLKKIKILGLDYSNTDDSIEKGGQQKTIGLMPGSEFEN